MNEPKSSSIKSGLIQLTFILQLYSSGQKILPLSRVPRTFLERLSLAADALGYKLASDAGAVVVTLFGYDQGQLFQLVLEELQGLFDG
jgi:hypothetical protein